MILPNEKFPLKTLMYKHAVGGQGGGGFCGVCGGREAPEPCRWSRGIFLRENVMNIPVIRANL